jgi:outer membrane lipoprotein-sorting protein
MNIPTYLARALAPVAIVVAAVPAQAQSNDIAKVEMHLAAVQSMTADFAQTDARNRVARGTLQLKRPGRIRFQYQGDDLILVGNGAKLTFVDYAVGQKNSWDLNKTPLGILLGARPDISRITRIMPQADQRVLLVRARDPRRPEFGTLILAFVRSPSSPGGLLLEGWTAIDAQNKRTTIKLNNSATTSRCPKAPSIMRNPRSGSDVKA